MIMIIEHYAHVYINANHYFYNSKCLVNVDCSITVIFFLRIFSILKIIIPIMLALCLMLSDTYYAENYASIVGQGLGVILN